MCPWNEAFQECVNRPHFALKLSKLGMTPLSCTTHMFPNCIEFFRVIFNGIKVHFWITSLEMIDGQTFKQVREISVPFMHYALMFVNLCSMIVKFVCEFLGEDNVALIILTNDIHDV